MISPVHTASQSACCSQPTRFGLQSSTTAQVPFSVGAPQGLAYRATPPARVNTYGQSSDQSKFNFNQPHQPSPSAGLGKSFWDSSNPATSFFAHGLDRLLSIGDGGDLATIDLYA